MHKESLNYDWRVRWVGGLLWGGEKFPFFPTASLAAVPNYPGSWRISDRAPPINAYKFSKVSSRLDIINSGVCHFSHLHPHSGARAESTAEVVLEGDAAPDTNTPATRRLQAQSCRCQRGVMHHSEGLTLKGWVQLNVCGWGFFFSGNGFFWGFCLTDTGTKVPTPEQPLMHFVVVAFLLYFLCRNVAGGACQR